MRTLVLGTVAGVGLVGSISNGIRLAEHFYLWPLVRLVGYGSLACYALLMLRSARYNNRFLTREETPE